MKGRRFRVFLAVLFLGLAASAVILLMIPRRPGTIVFFKEARPGGPTFGEETTLRNVSRRPILYTVRPSESQVQPQARRLEVGGLDRFRTGAPLEVTFDNGARTVSSTLFPGKPYSIRVNESDLLQVYLGSHGREDAADLAPFLPTPMPVVMKMLEMAEVGPGDVLYDLGCGDGRIVVAAAKTYGAGGVGIDIDPRLVEECRENARKEGVERLVRFICADVTKARFGEATAVSLYLLPESNETLRPALDRQLKPGTPVISHNYIIPGWEAKLVRQEKLKDENGREHRVLLYRR